MLAYLYGVADSQTHISSSQVLTKSHTEQAGCHHQQSTKEVTPERQPQVGLLCVEQCQVMPVDKVHILLDKVANCIESPDDIQTLQALIHVDKHAAGCVSSPALEDGSTWQVDELQGVQTPYTEVLQTLKMGGSQRVHIRQITVP